MKGIERIWNEREKSVSKGRTDVREKKKGRNELRERGRRTRVCTGICWVKDSEEKRGGDEGGGGRVRGERRGEEMKVREGERRKRREEGRCGENIKLVVVEMLVLALGD